MNEPLTQPDASPRAEQRSGLVLTTSPSPLSSSSQRSNQTATASARPDRWTGSSKVDRLGCCFQAMSPAAAGKGGVIRVAPSLRKSTSSTGVGDVNIK